MKILKDNSFLLCCRGKKCPIVNIENDTVTISDDYEQKVKMTMEQFLEIKKVFNVIENKETNS